MSTPTNSKPSWIDEYFPRSQSQYNLAKKALGKAKKIPRDQIGLQNACDILKLAEKVQDEQMFNEFNEKYVQIHHDVLIFDLWTELVEILCNVFNAGGDWVDEISAEMLYDRCDRMREITSLGVDLRSGDEDLDVQTQISEILHVWFKTSGVAMIRRLYHHAQQLQTPLPAAVLDICLDYLFTEPQPKRTLKLKKRKYYLP